VETKKERKIDLNMVPFLDQLIETPFRLIERNITYEHSLAERFYDDVYMGSAERNYYVDEFHEICLCAHYNRRIPGRYEFFPDWQFFITKKRMCLDIYWNLGNIPDENMIIEKYIGLESARKSPFFKDFKDLQYMINKSIRWKKKHKVDPFEFYTGSSFDYPSAKYGKPEYTVFQFPVKTKKELVQFYLNKATDKLKLMSVTKEPFSDMMEFFDDFDELDKNEIHMRKFLPIQEYAIKEGSPYHYLMQKIEERKVINAFIAALNEGLYY